MQIKVFIGCGAGFSGDRFDASIPIVKEFRNISEPKYLIFEVIALIELNSHAQTQVLQQIHYEEPIEI